MTTVNDRSAAPNSNTGNSELTDEEIFTAHEGGKLAVDVTAPLTTPRDLSIVYTPGVAKVSRAISGDETLTDRYTWTQQLVAVVSDGTAVLGLGDIGPRASLPVMEGKSALFKTFAGLNSIPLVLDTSDVDEVVETLVRLRPSFGAVNLEDVAAPRCFELERRLIEALDCPVMHDDQHGTAVVALAALRNACKVAGRELSNLRVVISGAGAAGVACAEILNTAGVGEIIVTDSRGVLHSGREGLTPIKQELVGYTNSRGVTGGLAEALEGADVLLGVSAGQIPEELIESMADDAVVFALSDPDPEVHPEVAGRHASVVATGRSDFPNQINNVLAFPGIFRGALRAGSRMITDRMKVAAAEAIAAVAADDLAADHIVPSALDPRVAPEVTDAVAAAAREDGVATA